MARIVRSLVRPRLTAAASILCLLALVPGLGGAVAKDYSTSEITKVVMLGSGMPLPDPRRSGPAVAIVVNGAPYIVDAGEGVWRATGAATPAYGGKIPALSGANLTKVFLTHLHSDHTVGLPSLILSPWTMGRSKPLDAYGPPGTRHLVEKILEAYRDDIDIRRFDTGMLNDTGWRARGHDFHEDGLIYQDENVKVEAFRVDHTSWPVAFAYRFTTPDKVVTISGDLRPCEGIIRASEGADILIHEVIGLDDRAKQPWGKGNFFGDVAPFFHTTTKELAELAQKIKPELLVLYHEQNWSNPYDPDALVGEIGRFGYDGLVVSAKDQDIY